MHRRAVQHQPRGLPNAIGRGTHEGHHAAAARTLGRPDVLRLNGGEAFPNLIVVLQGDGVTIHLVGDTYINQAGITSSTFNTIPDAPFTSAELTLSEGPYSALTAIGDLCEAAGKLKMPTEFVAQNGMEITESTPIGVTGCLKSKKPAKKKIHPKKRTHRKAKHKRRRR